MLEFDSPLGYVLLLLVNIVLFSVGFALCKIRKKQFVLAVWDVTPEWVWLVCAAVTCLIAHANSSKLLWFVAFVFVAFTLVSLWRDQRLEDDADPEYNTPPRGWRR